MLLQTAELCLTHANDARPNVSRKGFKAGPITTTGLHLLQRIATKRVDFDRFWAKFEFINCRLSSAVNNLLLVFITPRCQIPPEAAALLTFTREKRGTSRQTGTSRQNNPKGNKSNLCCGCHRRPLPRSFFSRSKITQVLPFKTAAILDCDQGRRLLFAASTTPLATTCASACTVTIGLTPLGVGNADASAT